MQFQSRPQAAISFFMEALEEGLITNSKLFQLELPEAKSIGVDLVNKLKAGHWWQRRVLDLALLQHFGVAMARPQLQTLATQILAQRALAATKP